MVFFFLRYFWNFHPEIWGFMIQFDEHIFQMGWNHQLLNEGPPQKRTISTGKGRILSSKYPAFLRGFAFFFFFGGVTCFLWFHAKWYYRDAFARVRKCACIIYSIHIHSTHMCIYTYPSIKIITYDRFDWIKNDGNLPLNQKMSPRKIKKSKKTGTSLVVSSLS